MEALGNWPTTWARSCPPTPCRPARPAAAGLLAVVVLLAAAGGAGAWQLHQQRATAQARQARTDQDVRTILTQGQAKAEEGWHAHDLAKLTEAEAEGHRAVDVARSG